MKCYSCGQRLRKDDAHYGDEKTYYQNKPLCETCYFEDEPNVTVYYNSDETPYIISSTRNETEGDFWVEWHSADPWRGYFETKSDKYSLVNTAELLSYHESEEMLARFDKRIRELFDENGIEYARLFARSSNVFYQNYDLYVKKDQSLLAHLLVAKAKQEVDYDNPRYYTGILFDESTLHELSRLFPEDDIRTDKDVLTLMEQYGDRFTEELQNRIRSKPDDYYDNK